MKRNPACSFAITAGLTLMCILSTATLRADDITLPDAADAGAEDEGIGLNIDLGFATHYMFRGLNLFGNPPEDPMIAPTPGLFPSIEWSIFNTGLSIGWFSAWQVSGDNIKDNIDAGLGAEQDLFVTYELALSDVVTFSAALYWYFYPFADKDAAGASFPNYLEPIAGIAWSTAVDLGLNVSFMAGLPEGFSQANYLYINPYIEKAFALHDRVDLELHGGFGYKLFTAAPDELSDNMFDVLVAAALPISIGAHFYLSPGVGFTWTNLQGTPAPGFSDEFVVYGALHAGADF